MPNVSTVKAVPVGRAAQLVNVLEAAAMQTLTSGKPHIVLLDDLLSGTGSPVEVGTLHDVPQRTYHGEGGGHVRVRECVGTDGGKPSFREYQLACNTGTGGQWQNLAADSHAIMTQLAERIPGAREQVGVRIVADME